ncbi:hypothetical protein [Austwickia sp. TVS 96-490-7B]|uniref:hypothetical protein n=1 Tax=Austwickia sp. TVS 96-490-7B TaxID=2830843 RepID=UPI001C55A24F|nr:hypothetical protein [Austwickia sp. TVS 96-490-7B]
MKIAADILKHHPQKIETSLFSGSVVRDQSSMVLKVYFKTGCDEEKFREDFVRAANAAGLEGKTSYKKPSTDYTYAFHRWPMFVNVVTKSTSPVDHRCRIEIHSEDLPIPFEFTPEFRDHLETQLPELSPYTNPSKPDQASDESD